MGLFSKIKKAGKNIFKGAKKAVKSVGHGFKKFFGSKAFKVMLAAGAIYVGYGLATQGAAFLGGTAAAAGTTAAGTGAVGATGGAEWAAASMGAPAMGGAASAAVPGAISGALPAGGATAGANWAASSMAAPTMVAPTVAPSATPGFMSTAGNFIEKNPLMSYGAMQLGGNMISSALAPNVADEQLRYDERTAERQRIAGLGGGSPGPVRVGNRTYG